MAKDLDDGEFWLPQFLNEDDTVIDCKKTQINGGFGDKFGGFFPYEFPFGFSSSGNSSDLSSPVESVVGSTETESDEEDYLAELTRKIAISTLQDDIWKSDSERKPWGMSGSPQSTLCGCKQAPAKMVTPPATNPVNKDESAWDLLYAAAGEVARMRIAEEGTGFYQTRGVSGPQRKPTHVSGPSYMNSNAGFYPNPPQSYQQYQVSQFQQMKQQQMMKNQSSAAAWGQSKPSNVQYQQQNPMAQNKSRVSNGRPLNLSLSAWPTLQQSQQNPGSGMRAVFLGDPVSKRECAGTGVFLPRRIGNPTENRKKPGCSTVLLPDRVVQALNLNLQEMESARPPPQSRYTGAYPTDFGVPLKFGNNGVPVQQRKNFRPPPVINNEVRLPQEWTY